MTYDQWFRSQQGIPYEGMYLFAEAAWEHQQKQIAALTRQRDLAVEALHYCVKQVPELATVPGIATAIKESEAK